MLMLNHLKRCLCVCVCVLARFLRSIVATCGQSYNSSLFGARSNRVCRPCITVHAPTRSARLRPLPEERFVKAKMLASALVWSVRGAAVTHMSFLLNKHALVANLHHICVNRMQVRVSDHFLSVASLVIQPANQFMLREGFPDRRPRLVSSCMECGGYLGNHMSCHDHRDAHALLHLVWHSKHTLS